MIFYTYEKNDMEEEKMDFIQHLYHDKRGGQMIRLRKSGEEVSQISTCDMDELAATGTDSAHFYTTVNTFRGWKRTADRVYNYTSIYIDLDCHSNNPEEIRIAKENTVRILEAAYESGALTIPTMITDTGRGFGLQYVLANSIANIDQTSSQRAFFKKVRKGIFEKYQEVLSADVQDMQIAQVDSAVLDDARVCRLPGTYNIAAGMYCRLIGVSGNYYELSDLVKGCHLWTWKCEEEYRREKEEKARKRRERAKNGNIISFSEYLLPFLNARLDQLQKLQELRGADCTNDCREQLLFIAYSTLVQINSETAAKRLQEINEKFTDPLDQSELDHIVEETDNSKGRDHQGYYKLKNEYLVERLGLSNEEIKAIGLAEGWKRSVERSVARKEKQKKREKVIDLLQQEDSLSYEQIAEATGVSRRKVCTIAREEGLMRYKKAAKRYENEDQETEQAKKAEIINIETIRNVDSQVDKSAKNAIRSVCVSFSAEIGVFAADSVGDDWYEWLVERSAGSSEALELLSLYDWSSSFGGFGVILEDFLERNMPEIMLYPERISHLLHMVVEMYIVELGVVECLVGLGSNLTDFPLLYDYLRQYMGYMTVDDSGDKGI